MSWPTAFAIVGSVWGFVIAATEIKKGIILWTIERDYRILATRISRLEKIK